MPCYHPIVRATDGEGNYRFYPKSDTQFHSGWLAVNTVPCRNCIGCRVRKKLDWSVRMCHELQTHDYVGSFITLTYDPENIPADGGLVKEHWQLFIKRLRDSIKPQKIKFFMCGEYGDESLRPHYHAAIFGWDFPDKTKIRTVKGNDYFTSPKLDKLWGKGMCVIGSLTRESAAYVAKYCQKKVTGDAAEQHYMRLDKETGELLSVIPEFQLSSNRPGLGSEWLRTFADDVFPLDEVVLDGKKYPVPEYYMKVLEKENPARYEQIKENRIDARRYKLASSTIDDLAREERVKILDMERQLLESVI